jgi:hypothetical protein
MRQRMFYRHILVFLLGIRQRMLFRQDIVVLVGM